MISQVLNRSGAKLKVKECAAILHAHGATIELNSDQLPLVRTLQTRSGELVRFEQLDVTVWPNDPRMSGRSKSIIDELAHVAGGRFSSIIAISPRGVTMLPGARIEEFYAVEPKEGLIGREADLYGIESALEFNRLVSVVGAGGVGKSALAHAISDMPARKEHGVAFVDLARVPQDAGVEAFIGASLGVDASSGIDALVNALKSREMLIVLDNCEHLIQAVAAVVERLLQFAPRLKFLATSREALRISGEALYRLQPLSLPTSTSPMTIDNAWCYSAIKLFVLRVNAKVPTFTLSRDNLDAVVRLCARLDGIPLALELAAGWVETFGLTALTRELDAHFFLHALSVRPQLERHRSLAALIDWSVSALSADERTTFVRLGAFRSSFDRDAALAVVVDNELARAAALRALSGLLAKSLISSDFSGSVPRFRLLETTRMLARDMLAATPESHDVFARHAQLVSAALKSANATVLKVQREAWLRDHLDLLSETVSALDWALAASGNSELSAQLAADSLPHSMFMPGLSEILTQARLALSEDSAKGSHCKEDAASRLIVGKYAPDNPLIIGVASAFEEDLEIAQRAYVEWANLFGEGRYSELAPAITTFRRAAGRTGKEEYVLIGKRIAAQGAHFLGEHTTAKELAEELLASSFETLPLSPVSHRVSMRVLLARTAFLQNADWMPILRDAERIAVENGIFTEGFCLVMGSIPIALWQNERSIAADLLARLLTISGDPALSYWNRCGRDIKLGLDFVSSLDPRTSRGRRIPLPIQDPAILDLLATFDPSLVTETAIDRARTGIQGWAAAEILRHDGPSGEGHLGHLHECLALALSHGELAWANRICEQISELRSSGDD